MNLKFDEIRINVQSKPDCRFESVEQRDKKIGNKIMESQSSSTKPLTSDDSESSNKTLNSKSISLPLELDKATGSVERDHLRSSSCKEA